MSRHSTRWSRAEIGIAGLLVAAAGYLAHARFGASLAIDLRPIYDSGEAVRSGHPIYSVPNFVYPPFAALTAVPLSMLNYQAAGYLYSVIQVAVPAASMAAVGALLFPRHRLLAAAVLAVLLLKSDVLVDSLFLYNPSLLFVLPLVAVAALWAACRWRAGAIVLGVSLAIKPLLAAVVLLPLASRRFGAVAVTATVALVLTVVGALFSHDLSGLLHIPGRIAAGTNLHGKLAAANVSLSGIGTVHPAARTLTYVVRAALVVATLAAVWRIRTRRLDARTAFIVTGALALFVPVCGSLDEVHYGILALPACVALVIKPTPVAARVLGLIGLLVLCAPLYNLHVTTTLREDQLRWGIGQAVVLVACIVAMLLDRHSDVPAHTRPAALAAEH